jgi:hypothetical protein
MLLLLLLLLLQPCCSCCNPAASVVATILLLLSAALITQVDGSRDEMLEDPLMVRQQLEGSALPGPFKRAQLMGFWNELLLESRRTVKITKGGKVRARRAAEHCALHGMLIAVLQLQPCVVWIHTTLPALSPPPPPPSP